MTKKFFTKNLTKYLPKNLPKNCIKKVAANILKSYQILVIIIINNNTAGDAPYDLRFLVAEPITNLELCVIKSHDVRAIISQCHKSKISQEIL